MLSVLYYCLNGCKKRFIPKLYIHLFVWKGMLVSLRIESVYSTTLFFYSYRDCS